MYSTSKQVENALNSDGRTFKAYIEVEDDNGNIVTLDDFYKLEIKGASTDSTEAFQIGTSVATQISVTMENPTITLTGKEIKLYLGIVVYDEENEEESTITYVPMGVYIPEKPTVSNNQITFEAFDLMGSRLAREYVSDLNYPCDVFKILTEIETLTGVTVSEKPTGLMINKRVESEDGTAIIYTNPFDSYTYAQTLGMIAGYYGKFATMNRTGEVEFRGYTQNADVTYFSDEEGNILTASDNSRLYSGEENEYIVSSDSSYADISEQEETFSVGYLQCTVDNDLVLKSGEGTTGINFSCMLMTQDRLDELYKEYKDFSYTPTTVSFKGDFRLDLGDMVSVERLDGTLINVPVMSLSHTYDGGFQTAIGSYGTTEETDGYVSPTEKAISRVYQKLAVVENLIATKTLTVGQIECPNLLDNSLTCAGGNVECINLSKGTINEITEEEGYVPTGKESEEAQGTYGVCYASGSSKGQMLRVEDILTVGQWYTVSFWFYVYGGYILEGDYSESLSWTLQILNEKQSMPDRGYWKKYVFTFKAEKEDLEIYINSDNIGYFRLYQMQIEKGKEATQYCEKFDSINDVLGESKDIIKKFCYDNNMTYIDGGKIYAGTITSKQLNVDDLFAEDITATGNFSVENVYQDDVGNDRKFLLRNDAQQLVVGNYETFEYPDGGSDEKENWVMKYGMQIGDSTSELLTDKLDINLGHMLMNGDNFKLTLGGKQIASAGYFSSENVNANYLHFVNLSELYLVADDIYLGGTVKFSSQWVNLSLGSSFEPYTSGVYPRYKVVGNTVFLQGTVKPKSTISAGSTASICTLPVGARPSRTVQLVCQGSGMNRWLLAIGADGNVTFSRYGITSTVDATSAVWLPFYATFTIDA